MNRVSSAVIHLSIIGMFVVIASLQGLHDGIERGRGQTVDPTSLSRRRRRIHLRSL